MAFVTGILTPMCLDGNRALNWRRYKRNFEIFIRAYHDDKPDENKIALLLHSGGEELLDIFDSFGLTDDQGNKLDEVLKRFDDFFVPTANVTYERFVFFTRRQSDGETYEQYTVALQNLSRTCEFGTLCEGLVRDIFVAGINDRSLQERLLNTTGLTKAKAIEACRSKVVVSQQVEQIQQPIKLEPNVDVVGRNRKHNKSKMFHGYNNDKSLDPKCRFCGFEHVYGRCPAYGKVCAKCKSRNHFARMCAKFKNSVNAIDDQNSPNDSEFIDIVLIDDINSLKGFWYTVKLGISRWNVEFKIDTGAACNVMGLPQYKRLGLNLSNLQNTHIVLRSFSKDKVPVIGKCSISCMYNSEPVSIEFMIIDRECANILGIETSEALGLISRVDCLSVSQRNCIPPEYVHLFDGNVGCMPDVVKIELDPNIKPVVSPLRRIPLALLPKVKSELDRMESTGIIKKIDEPTAWVNQMVVVLKKDGSLRICLDPRNLNKAIRRAHYPFPTIDEICANLKDAKYFCKLDAQSGFWMLPLDNESSKLCTFQTAWGRYSFLRLPFGLNSAPEIFHSILSKAFDGISNVTSFQDDILIWGNSKEEVDQTLKMVLERANSRGIKFNPNKCVFNSMEIEFLGHTFSEDGVSVSQDKVKAVLQLKRPTDKKSLQRVLGMFNYVSKFIPGFADLTAPLRELLKNDVIFLWNEKHETALECLKKAVTRAPVLGFFNPEDELKLSVDSSSFGLGATVLQRGRPLGFASKVLTDAQTRYSQIEKELLAVCFGVEKFKQYIVGMNEVKVETDHKPLLGLFDKPLHKIPARLQRLMLRLCPYNLKLSHTPGKYMYVADTLSRDFSMTSSDDQIHFEDDDGDLMICVLAESLPLIKSEWELFVNETVKDPVCAKLKNYILNGWPEQYNLVDDSCKLFFGFRNELVVMKDVIFRGNRILVPKSLQFEMLVKLHSGHPGINRTLSRASESLFWIGVSQDIKKFVKSCKTCLKFQDNKIKMNLKSHTLPKFPWMDVAGDTFQINQKNYLVLVDVLTNFCEVVSLPDLRSPTVIEKMKSIFARHGIPITFYSDGALYFDSSLFQKFAKEWGFNHIMSSPNYPTSNGHAEVSVKSIKRLLMKAVDSGEDPFLALLNYRNTPRGKLNSPAANLMGRRLRTNIPTKLKNLKPRITIMRDRKLILEDREKMKDCYDRNARYRAPFNVGQNVMFQKVPNSVWLPGKVVGLSDCPRSYFVQGQQGGTYRRNEIHVSPRSERATFATRPIRNSTTAVNVPRFGSPTHDSSNHGEPFHSGATLSQNAEYRTRAGRLVKVPSKLKDFVQ